MNKRIGRRLAGLMLMIVPCLAQTGLAERFVPVPMKISAPNWMSYNFDGSPLSIPVTLSGTPGLGVMLIFTSGKGESIHKVRNGNLGWHYVDNIDTCLYVSPQIQFSLGANVVTWDGKDEDGHYVPVGEYAYYLWAYSDAATQYNDSNAIDVPGPIITHDENGNPLSRPVRYRLTRTFESPYRYFLGKQYYGDDSGFFEMTFFPVEEFPAHFILDPHDYSFIYGQSLDNSGMLVTRKWKFVPNGDAVLQKDWAHNGEALIPSEIPPETFAYYPDPMSDGGDAIFFTNVWNTGNGSKSGFVWMDISNGEVTRTFDMTTPWSIFKDSAPPYHFQYSSGMFFFTSSIKNLAQMVDPYTETDSDPVRWETYFKKDPPFNHAGIFPDRFEIALISEGAFGNNCFELIAPDGSEVGFFPHFEEYDPDHGISDNLAQVIDTGTPYDGLYFVNGWRFHAGEVYPSSYRASDSFRGRLGVFDAWGPYVALLSPAGKEALKGGSERYITWTSQGIENMRIEYSPDGGAHWQTVTESVKASAQRFLWTVPNVSSNTCQMRLIDTTDSRNMSSIGVFAIVVLTGVEDEQAASPRPFITASTFPNPFNPSTTIKYTLGLPGKVTITVYNALGQQVIRIDHGRKNRGTHEVVINGEGLTSGIYIYRITTENATTTGKMLLLR